MIAWHSALFVSMFHGARELNSPQVLWASTLPMRHSPSLAICIFSTCLMCFGFGFIFLGGGCFIFNFALHFGKIEKPLGWTWPPVLKSNHN